jgi:hypothetical protein
MAFDATFYPQVLGRKIGGTCEYFNPVDGAPMKLRLHNGVFDGTILKIEFRDQEDHVFRLGSAVLELNHLGNELSGRFVGYSPAFRTITTGSLVFRERADGTDNPAISEQRLSGPTSSSSRSPTAHTTI